MSSPIATPMRGGSGVERAAEHAERQVLDREIARRALADCTQLRSSWIVRLVDGHRSTLRIADCGLRTADRRTPVRSREQGHRCGDTEWPYRFEQTHSLHLSPVVRPLTRATSGSTRRPRSASACRLTCSGRNVSTITASSSVPCRADRRLGAARVRAVRHAVGVQRDRAVLDALAAHELGAGVVDHLVRHHVRVVVGHRHRVRIEVERPRAERADDEAVALERLVHRRRQVHAPDARLEVVDAERPRIVVAVPADDVERDGATSDISYSRFSFFTTSRELALLVVRRQRSRAPDVALASTGASR